MIFEFAVEPEAVATPAKLSRLIENCGVEHGRLVSQFPRKWQQLVYDAAKSANSGDQELKKLEVMLWDHEPWQMQRRLYRAGRGWDPQQGWMANVLQQHSVRPFRAIVARAVAEEHPDRVLAIEELDLGNPFWVVPRSVRIPRTATDLCGALLPLMQASNRARLVDPHFRPTKDGRFTRVVSQLLERIANNSDGCRLWSLEVHVEYKPDPDHKDWEEGLRESIPVPDGLACSVRFIRWRERTNGERLHARFVLTEIGGIMIDPGLDVGRGKADLCLIDRAHSARLFDAFSDGSEDYERVDCFELHAGPRHRG